MARFGTPVTDGSAYLRDNFRGLRNVAERTGVIAHRVSAGQAILPAATAARGRAQQQLTPAESVATVGIDRGNWDMNGFARDHPN
jgi:hypothetical protein